MNNYHYLICGITISFPWKILMLPESTRTPDAWVEFGRAPRPEKDSVRFIGPYCQAAPSHTYFHLKNIAKISIRTGNNITVEISGRKNTETLNTFLLSSCLGVLLIQRGLLVLHAAALEKNGRVVAFSGGPGTGKSTLSALLLESGANILSDNIAAITLKGINRATVSPSFPSIHLWRSTIEKLKLSNRHLNQLRPGLDKYAVSFENQFIAQPLHLNTLCILSPWNKNELCCNSVQGMERITQLSNASFRLKITRGMEMDRQNFLNISALSSSINIVKLCYPQDWEHNEKVVSLIEATLFDSNTFHLGQPIKTL
jgi:hypothetical protein